jgi:single-stranded DNA-binding protein
MLNKIKVSGKILPNKTKKRNENDQLLIYFSLLVVNPNNTETLLRCHAGGRTASEIEKEVEKEQLIEVRGYLRNERIKDGKKSRQIVVQVLGFNKLEKEEETSDLTSNQVQLLGKIITDLTSKEDTDSKPILSFKLETVEGNNLGSFFCKTKGELAVEISERLKKKDVVLLEGFLQTRKITDTESIYSESVSWISLVFCHSFVLIDTAEANTFHPLSELSGKVALVSKEIEKIDFTKPKQEKK